MVVPLAFWVFENNLYYIYKKNLIEMYKIGVLKYNLKYNIYLR